MKTVIAEQFVAYTSMSNINIPSYILNEIQGEDDISQH
jgi:hypothetical protein